MGETICQPTFFENIILFSTEERNAYRFVMAWGKIIDDRILILRVDYIFKGVI